MIKINLLPIRAESKGSTLRLQAIAAAVLLLVVAGVCYWFYDGVLNEVADAQTELQRIQTETSRLQSIIGEIEQIKSRKADLEKKLEVIDSLEKDRLTTVKVMETVARATPEQLWLTNLEYVGGNVKVTGSATDNQIIAKYIQTLSQTPGVSNIVLSETKRGKEDGYDVVQFSMIFSIKVPNEAKDGLAAQRKG